MVRHLRQLIAPLLRAFSEHENPLPAAPAGRGWSPFFWLTLAAFFTFARAPGLLLEPRLFAEEASVYLVYSRHSSILSTLFLIPTADGPAGYMMFFTNLVMAAAKTLPLELVPRLTSVAAFLVQLLPIGVVLFSRSACWPTARLRVGAALVLTFSPALDPEVWLTTLHAPIFLALAATAILVAESPASRLGRWAARAILGLGAATGAYTTLLLPVFLLRAYQSRHREHYVQLGWVAVPALLQGFSFVFVRFVLETAPTRPWPPWEALVTSVAFHHLGHGLIGPVFTEFLTGLCGLFPALADPASCQSDHLRLAGVVSFGLIATFFTLTLRATRGPSRWLVWALAASCALPALLAYGIPRGRYAVVAGVTAGLIALALAGNVQPSRLRRVAQTLLLVSIGAGTGFFWRDPPLPMFDSTFRQLRPPAEHRPQWDCEVAHWRQDPSPGLRVWPYTEKEAWTAYLRSENTPESSEIRVPRTQLISIGESVSRVLLRIPAQSLTFKVVAVLVAQTDGILEAELHAIGEDGEVVGLVPLGRLEHREQRTVVIHPKNIHWLEKPQPVIGFDLQAKASRGGRVTFLETRIEPLVVGLFDLL